MRIAILGPVYVMLFCGCFAVPVVGGAYNEITRDGHPPLAQEFGSKPGAYDLAIRVSQPIVDPGDKLQVEVYISGYGVVQAAKVAFYPSPQVFDLDPNRSMMTTGIKRYDDGRMGWGGTPVKFDPTGGVLTLSGGFVSENNPSWQRPTWFCDANERQVNHYQIATEVKHPQGTSPVCLDLTVHNDATPGPHSIHFVLTYFDGQTWKTASKNADFTIRNFYQRHEIPVWILGGLAAIVTIGAPVWPVLRRLWPVSVVLAFLGGLAGRGKKIFLRYRTRPRKTRQQRGLCRQ